MGAAEILTNVAFYVFAAVVAVGAVAVASSRNIVRSAFSLLAVLFGAAALYALMKADFIAAAQILIYVGGILVLIIFAVMLTHRITDVNVSNESTPGPAAFCACLCLLFALVVVVLFTGTWDRGAEALVRNEGPVEVRLKQYQADGRTGLKWSGNTFEDGAVLEVEVVRVPEGTTGVKFEVARGVTVEVDESKGDGSWTGTLMLEGDGLVALEKGRARARIVVPASLGAADAEKGKPERRWQARLTGATGPLTGWFSRGEESADFTVYPGVTKPAALALMGNYLLAFEVVSVLLLAALVGAAFLARKEVRT